MHAPGTSCKKTGTFTVRCCTSSAFHGRLQVAPMAPDAGRQPYSIDRKLHPEPVKRRVFLALSMHAFNVERKDYPPIPPRYGYPVYRKASQRTIGSVRSHLGASGKRSGQARPIFHYFREFLTSRHWRFRLARRASVRVSDSGFSG